MLFLASLLRCTKVEDTNVLFTNNFPALKGAHLTLEIKKQGRQIRLKMPIEKNHFRFSVDSLDEGIASIFLTYPWPKDSRRLVYRDKSGEVAESGTPIAKTIILKGDFYINPQQSRTYNLSMSDKVTAERFQKFKAKDYHNAELFGIRVESESKDSQLFDVLEQVKTEYQHVTYLKLLDSLYTASTRKDKLYDDFEESANDFLEAYRYGYVEKLLDIIESKPGNPVSVLTLLTLNPVDIQDHQFRYEEILNSITGRAKSSSYYQRAIIKLTAFNSDHGDLKGFQTPEGKTPNLEEFGFDVSKQRYTLLEFWASWCMPCRKTNPKWNEILKKNKSSDFRILGVSLDESLDDWREAITRDTLDNWQHVSDLDGGFNGINSLKYGIDAIPYNMLINGKAEIILEDITPPELDRFLSVNLKELK